MLWSKQVVIDVLSSKKYTIAIGEYPGGDYDLLPLYVHHPDKLGEDEDFITITPFIDPQSKGVVDPNLDQDIVAVEVRCQASDSRGGCESDDEIIVHMYADVKLVLKKMGHNVIRHYDEIF